MTNTISKTHHIDHTMLPFEKQLALFFEKGFEMEKKEPTLKENLGQVFTPPALAKFMIGLLKQTTKRDAAILDPCIGPNTFFNHLTGRLANCHLKGVEIDERLITSEIKQFYDQPNRELVEGSFFDLPIEEKFDFIIQNPPYVRQELLAFGVNANARIKNNGKNRLVTVPSQSNLYVYFLLKSILHLKDGGTLVAVIYDSWLYSSFGNFLKDTFLKLGFLHSIYHFKKNAFENAEVGATVIRFVKATNNSEATSYYPLNDLNDLNGRQALAVQPQKLTPEELLAFNFNNASNIDCHNDLFTTMESISTTPVHRGTSAIVNSYFIFREKRFIEAKPLIKDVSSIKTYTADKEDAFVLVLNGSISKKTQKYINSVKRSIINAADNKYKAVKKDIQTNGNWHRIKPKESGNIIFNYYLRNNIDFIFNPNKSLSSDNFYALNIERHVDAHLAILNSSFTKLSILNRSRSQGNGLRKIQLYEFKEVRVFNIDQLPDQTVIELAELGASLLLENRYQKNKHAILEKIDVLLLDQYNNYNNSLISLEDLRNELKEYSCLL